jgi:hypothetical protein
MGWSIGYDDRWKRDVGYGVPAVCDEPGCDTRIDRGLGYVCGGEPFGGEEGCGLFFCSRHRFLYVRGKSHVVCARCRDGAEAHEPKRDLPEWVNHKLTDESWAEWRAENPTEVARLSGANR